MATAQEKTAARRRASTRRGQARVVNDARQLASDASAVAGDARRLGNDMRRMITDHPLQAIAVAVGAGFVVAGGLSPAVLRSFTGLAGRLAMIAITKRAVEMLDERAGGGTERSSSASRRSAARHNTDQRK